MNQGGESRFKQGVRNIVSKVPKGSVVSYGQVAAYLGVPRGARQVGRILSQNRDDDLPWWRVVNNKGRISIKGHWSFTPDYQKQLLMREGVWVDADLNLDIDKYRYRPDKKQLSEWGLSEIYLDMIWKKFKEDF